MTITFDLTEHAAANLLAEAQRQGRPQAALIAEAIEERYAHQGLGTVAESEDDLYASAMRYKATDGSSAGRTYALDMTMDPETMAALEHQYGVTTT